MERAAAQYQDIEEQDLVWRAAFFAVKDSVTIVVPNTGRRRGRQRVLLEITPPRSKGSPACTWVREIRRHELLRHGVADGYGAFTRVWR